ncbi:hypothetical protein BN1723_019139, partial [Verticillium longisporum]
WT